jgi:CTP:molybdopterin cytidylyltransferase MocA
MKSDCAVLITAAGLSGRMVVSKALLKWNEEMNFLQKIISTYTSFGCNEIIVTLNEGDYAVFNTFASSSVHFILNSQPQLERMYSIQLGLQAIKNSSYCFIQCIDNPFISTVLLEEIYQHKSQESYVNPAYHGENGHPVLINAGIIEKICYLDITKLHLSEVLKKFPRKKVVVENPEILYNINTMAEYQKLVIGY